ncbi:pimeloyl-ACP methyl ester carboxylesterase [Kaistia hirudinis]|uniref:Pimeloyl-ACP methyl ester carboxylesterase n=1 Tax=Kaistia hirudinis TaxID=1293440 RepID=A0A840AKQ3_9HYPH|nr:alpha/beta hydrolase [Kaistia hirudinis]MBB3929066.1 pimeloyl-ACP methyl ester carboxylesterase [Kaistia hirudinis]
MSMHDLTRSWRTALAALAIGIVANVATAGAPAFGEEIWKTLPDPKPLPKPDQTGTLDVDGAKIWYATFGEGKGSPVLLLHGGLGNSDYWGNQVPALTDKHEVIVIDTRGHGRSTKGDKPFSYDLFASDALAVLDHLKIDKVALVGWSDGGITGLDIAINHPERLSKLWAFGANYNVSGVKPNVDKDPVFGAYIEKAGKDYEKISPTPKDYEAFVNALVALWYSQPDYKAEQLAKITTPTVIADGQYDEGIKPEHTEELAKLIPNAKLLILPNLSHFAHWQDPATYNKDLVAFIDGP